MTHLTRNACLAACIVALAAEAGPLPAVQTLRLTPAELAARENEAARDPVALLRLVPLAPQNSARRLRRRVFELLAEQQVNATAAEMAALAAGLSAVLPQAIRSPVEAREVLGPPAQVSRQLLYRRYLEEWTYDRPVPLGLIFDCQTGALPRLQSVHGSRPGKK